MNTRRGILEEMKNQNMLRFKASRRVPATVASDFWHGLSRADKLKELGFDMLAIACL